MNTRERSMPPTPKQRPEEAKTVSKPISLPRDLPVCDEGVQAYLNDVAVDDCPYAISDPLRQGWMTGWYDEKMRTKLGHIWEKYNLQYP